jgi:defect-in-organelle-trafficking protein DotC
MRILTATIFSCLLLAAPCVGASEETPDALREVLAMRGTKASEMQAEARGLRLRIVKEAAYAMGVQAGAKWRNERISEVLEGQAAHLDTIFAFRLLLIDGQVLPPIIVRSDRSTELSDRTVVKTGTSYKIIKDARFVSTPPSWRDYFQTEFTVREVAPNLYPNSSEEVEAWEQEVARGWALGVQQADNIFEINMRLLTRDMRGLILFRQLAGQGYLSLPQVATGRYAIRIGDKNLDMDQTSFTIVEDSKFQPEDKWEPFQMSP